MSVLKLSLISLRLAISILGMLARLASDSSVTLSDASEATIRELLDELSDGDELSALLLDGGTRAAQAAAKLTRTTIRNFISLAFLLFC
jgi:hypothetical protein